MNHKKNFLVLFSIFACAFIASAKDINISGTVNDETGQPLVGATVMVKGTGNGTITDLDGNFHLSVPQGSTVEFLCLGMTTQSRVIDGKTSTFTIVLTPDTLMLEDVVVVGYGTQKKSSLTSAVSAIKGDELLKAPSTNVSQILAGRLPGISSVQESGEPGLDQASLKIRGSVYSVTYVVDGFPVDNINDIDPADIESVSVLKDGASAAVYGLQAAGGVIIITTKKGEKGDTKINYTTSIGLSLNANFPKFMDGPQFLYYYNVADMMDQFANGEIESADEYVPYFSKQDLEMVLNDDPTDGWDNVDYIGKVFGTGVNQKHNLTIQGGTDKGRYFTSFGVLDQKGNIDNFNYRRYNVRSNIEGTIGKQLDYKVGLSGVISKRSTPAFLSGGGDTSSEQGFFSIARQAIGMWPFLPEKMDGVYTASVQKNLPAYPVSPIAAIYESGYKSNNALTASVNASLQYRSKYVEGLAAKVSGSYDYSVSYDKNLSIPYTTTQSSKNSYGDWVWNECKGNLHVVENSNTLGEGAVFSKQMVGQASIAYVHSFADHNIDALLLGEARQYEGNGLAAYVNSLPFTSLPELSNGVATSAPVSGWSAASRSVGFVFRAKYDYQEKYLAEFTGRYDGSYKFAGMSNNRWGFFPSASVGWRLSKEDFMAGFTSLEDLKLRASIGLLGNDNVSEYSFMSTYGQGGNVVYGRNGQGSTLNPAYYTSGVPNTDLTWEKTLSYNVGFDMTMWGGLLGFEVDGFYNYTFDMLTYQSTGFPSSMGGYYSTWVNQNAIDARGIDVLVSHRNHFDLFGKAFWYDVAASATYSHTRWLKYNDDPNIVDYRKVTGTTYGSILCWKADGLFRSEEEIDHSAWYGTRPNIGDIKYIDINGDGKIDEDDKGYFGRSNRPALTFGLNFNAAFCGFDLNLQFTGGTMFDVSMTGTYFNDCDDNTIWTQTFKEGSNSPLFLVQNAYSIYNPDGTFPRLTLSNTSHGGDNGLSSTFWIRDGSYVRLKTAQLGYTIPKKVLKGSALQNLRVFVEGQNVFTIDALPDGIDPESPGVNNGYYPQQKLLMGGLSITF